MEVRLLGPVDAWVRGRKLDLGPRKQRLTLALLALEVNLPVTVDRLVDLTWSEAAPRTARHAVHVRISQLRAAISNDGGEAGSAEILTRGSAYILRTDPMGIDVHRFRALLKNARDESVATTKASMLYRALRLWHGPPLADVATSPVDRLCRGLEESRLAALEEWLDTELRQGKHGAIVDQLIELTAEHPHRQRMVAMLMIALYRDGRAPEALRAYPSARHRLAGEFGLDPHTRLQKLESAILRADPSLDLPRPTSVG